MDFQFKWVRRQKFWPLSPAQLPPQNMCLIFYKCHGHQINCMENLSSNANYYITLNCIKIHLSNNFDRLWLLTWSMITIKWYWCILLNVCVCMWSGICLLYNERASKITNRAFLTPSCPRKTGKLHLLRKNMQERHAYKYEYVELKWQECIRFYWRFLAYA